MGKRTKHVTYTDFYCMNCGNKSMSLPRKQSRQYKSFHRKKLYCPHCKTLVNHVECKNEVDAYNFKQDFEEGLYTEEAKESIEYIAQEEMLDE